MANLKWSQILMAIWFLLTGLFALTNFRFEFAAPVMGLLALAIGILMLLGR